MKKTKIFYWIFTSLFGAMMLSSAIPDVLMMPMAIKGMHEGLGYPVYFVPFIGVAKIAGVAAIVLPVSPRIKEWAYAGLFFDLVGATYSIIASNTAEGSPAFMIIPFLLAILSYVFYLKKAKAGVPGAAYPQNQRIKNSPVVLS